MKDLATKQNINDLKLEISNLKSHFERLNNTNLRWTILLWIAQLGALAGVIKMLLS